MESHSTELLRTNCPSLGKRPGRGRSESTEERAGLCPVALGTVRGNPSWETKLRLGHFQVAVKRLEG